MTSRLWLLPGILLLAAPAWAEVIQSEPHAITVEHKIWTGASPAELYRALGRVEKWWSGKHTVSGSAANLRLATVAGGCFCERWKEGSAEHGRVIQVQRDRSLRLSAALGPLLVMAVNGVLTFDLRPPAPQRSTPGGTELVVTYRLSGDPSHQLSTLGPPVDRVVGEQAARLVRFVETGKPE